MAKHPYIDLPKSSFWKSGVANEDPCCMQEIYKKKFQITDSCRIATAGSCFAQHITANLKANGYQVLDIEPPPPGLPEPLHKKYGYSMYSGRYGNIYTVRQLLQLLQEVSGAWAPEDYIWERNGRYFDALRPGIEPNGLSSPNEVKEHRQRHLQLLSCLFASADVFIFTLGLTEAWVHKGSGTVYPTAPGTIAGSFNPKMHSFINFQFADLIHDFNSCRAVLSVLREGKPIKIILTVSPVPLTATASGCHVLVANTYSKSVLRAAAAQLTNNSKDIDYFPSYEIVTNPRQQSASYQENFRSIREESVKNVMNHFFSEHVSIFKQEDSLDESLITKPEELSDQVSFEYDLQCEEALLEAFAE